MRGYERLFIYYIRRKCNHSGSMVVDLEVDANVKVSPKVPAVFGLVVQLL